MSEWQPIETAPMDGTPFQARIPGYGNDNIIAWLALAHTDGNEHGAWHFVEDQEPPDCWTDGVCWDVNEDWNPSVKPTHWQPLPEPRRTPPLMNTPLTEKPARDPGTVLQELSAWREELHRLADEHSKRGGWRNDAVATHADRAAGNLLTLMVRIRNSMENQTHV